MSGVEVTGYVDAIASAFQGGADLVHGILERKQRKKRRKESETEQMYAEKMLHKAMLESTEKCQMEAMQRHQRFGPAFARGDLPALSELKDIMMNVQMEVIQPLQAARIVDNAVLDVTRLHEAVITNKNYALRSMDYLCQRIMAYQTARRQQSQDYTASPMGSPGLPTSMTLPGYVRAPPHHQGAGSPDMGVLTSMSRLPLHDSGASGTGEHRVYASVASTSGSQRSTTATTGSGRDGDGVPDRSISVWSKTTASSGDSMCSSEPSTRDTPKSTVPEVAPEVYETEEEAWRANSAPEVVTKEFESMLARHAYRQTSLQSSTQPDISLQNIHPALRDMYTIDSPIDVFEELDYPWTPLPRPAKHNNYNGFCKGAWKTRQKLEEGLSIAMLPNSKGVVVPHWKCKHCDFSSKSMNNSNALPDSVYLDQRGIRYRWIFLAKSHAKAMKPQEQNESYSYGCIFCAAQGRETARHEDLKSLFGHVLSKHKTAMLTPEVREKTKCVVGGTPDKLSEWEINFPESKGRDITGTVGKFMVSAVTGLK